MCNLRLLNVSVNERLLAFNISKDGDIIFLSPSNLILARRGLQGQQRLGLGNTVRMCVSVRLSVSAEVTGLRVDIIRNFRAAFRKIVRFPLLVFLSPFISLLW